MMSWAHVRSMKTLRKGSEPRGRGPERSIPMVAWPESDQGEQANMPSKLKVAIRECMYQR